MRISQWAGVFGTLGDIAKNRRSSDDGVRGRGPVTSDRIARAEEMGRRDAAVKRTRTQRYREQVMDNAYHRGYDEGLKTRRLS